MNAPTTAATVAKPAVQLLAVSSLVPSKTHVQELRRARFDKAALTELARNIAEVGILQYPVVRPIAGGKHEIVAGERRVLAAERAGLKEIHCNVRELTDDQALEAQLSENLQREDLHELEEAEGYEELMKLKKINVDQVAEMVGKSRSYVYARTKLLALCPEARKAFYGGALDASRALLIARIGHHDTQRQALKDVTRGHGGEPMSFREAHHHILRTYMLRLKEAVFDIADATLFAKAGACGPCQKRTGNQRDLFGDVKDADVCTDPKCFDEKRTLHMQAELRRLTQTGKKVVHGAEAAKILPNWSHGSDYISGGYVTLDQTTWAGGSSRKVGDILGKDFDPLLVQHPGTGKILKLATQQQVTSALHKGKKSTTTSRSKASAAGNSSNAGSFETREKVAVRIGDLLIKKHPGTLGRAELLYLVQREHEAWDGTDDSLYKAFKLPTTGLNKALGKLSDKDLVRFMVAGAVTDGLLGGMYDTVQFAKTTCARFKLDQKKVEAEIRAEVKNQAETEKLAAALKSKKPTWSSKALPATTGSNFLQPMLPSDQLAIVIGDKPLQRTEITKKLWGYIKRNGLQDKKNRRMLNADAKLFPIFRKKQVSMFEMTKLVSKHLRVTKSAPKAKPAKKKAKGKKK